MASDLPSYLQAGASTVLAAVALYAAISAGAKSAKVDKHLHEQDVRERALHAEVLATHAEVRTGNAQTAGQLLDAAESRRVEDIPAAARTDQESEHLAANPVPPGPESS